MADLVEGTQVVFRTTFRDQDGAIIDLTAAASVTFRYNVNEGTVTNGVATVIDATGGRAEFTLIGPNNLPGNLKFEWAAVLASGAPIVSRQTSTKTVRPIIQAPAIPVPD